MSEYNKFYVFLIISHFTSHKIIFDTIMRFVTKIIFENWFHHLFVSSNPLFISIFFSFFLCVAIVVYSSAHPRWYFHYLHVPLIMDFHQLGVYVYNMYAAILYTIVSLLSIYIYLYTYKSSMYIKISKRNKQKSFVCEIVVKLHFHRKFSTTAHHHTSTF